VDVTQVGPQQAHEMNMCGAAYGMSGNDFYTFLTRDIEEKESLRQAREQEEEKAMYSVSVAMPYQKHLVASFSLQALRFNFRRVQVLVFLVKSGMERFVF